MSQLQTPDVYWIAFHNEEEETTKVFPNLGPYTDVHIATERALGIGHLAVKGDYAFVVDKYGDRVGQIFYGLLEC